MAFSEYANTDSRIDPQRLSRILGSAFPTEALEQNRVWYRLYRSVEADPSVRHVHKDFLLLRDYAGLCTLFIVVYGAAPLYLMRPVSGGLMYVGPLVVKYLVVRQAAANYGIRLVTTVLAVKTAEPRSEV